MIRSSRRSVLGVLLLSPLVLAGLDLRAQDVSTTVVHRMQVTIEPVGHSLRVTDEIALPRDSTADAPREFLLNAALEIVDSDPAVSAIPLDSTRDSQGLDDESTSARLPVKLARYRLSDPAADRVTLTYAGNVHYPLTDPSEEYTRGFRHTAGLIGPEGVYLSRSAYWYPLFDDGLLEFELTVRGPADWHLISQGTGSSSHAGDGAHWRSEGPTDEIYLVGGPLQIYRQPVGEVEALVYLRQPDAPLASTYLGATEQYLRMYDGLIAPYPYSKFALIENFWETGYGMPSFTLLGPTVIRFPFILHSSYPHEILHNWWGNSVYVDYQTGNWCEGLTAYMADHLIKEQEGQGEEYRRSTLQKYRDYVSDSADFPLSDFRSRHSASTEAVGYGKTLMGFHMLRRRLGDDAFRRAMAAFYRSFRGHKASFTDLQATLEATSGLELGEFFDQWVSRPGAASLRVSVDEVRAAKGGFRIEGSIAQLQGGAPFSLRVPVAVLTAEGRETLPIELVETITRFALEVPARPLLLQVDPQFDVFRLLDACETPPSIGQIFGAASIVAILPSAAPLERLEAYRELMAAWQSDSHHIEVQRDDEMNVLPQDRSVWVLGSDNRFADLFRSRAEIGLEIGDDVLVIDGAQVPAADHSSALSRRHAENGELVVGWLVVDPLTAFPGIARKLPHYGKYSYLAFRGDEPSNVLKGVWPNTDSPLVIDLRPAGDRRAQHLEMPLDQRPALAQLPPPTGR